MQHRIKIAKLITKLLPDQLPQLQATIDWIDAIDFIFRKLV